MMIENLVLRGIETRLAHFRRNRVAYGIGNALTKGTRGRFNAGSFVKFRMSRSDAVKLAEVFDLLQGHIVTRQVQPPVEKHAAVARGENKAVAIQPTGIVRIVVQRVAIKHGPNLGRAKGQPEVAGLGFRHRIHCQSARVASGQFESRNIKTHN